jgi:hypothetical protein
MSPATRQQKEKVVIDPSKVRSKKSPDKKYFAGLHKDQ